MACLRKELLDGSLIMRPVWLAVIVAGFVGMLAGLPGSVSGQDRAGNFDFYVLSLSWSPSWCAENDQSGRTMQCNGKRRYGLVVHGLWPQNQRSWPEYCASNEPERVPEGLVRPYYDIIPSAGLAGHEWRKHGSCSGLTQPVYFRTMRTAFERIRLPPLLFKGDVPRRLSIQAIESQIVRANPGLPADAIALSCDAGALTEIRICLSKTLNFQSCADVDRRSCRANSVLIPAIP